MSVQPLRAKTDVSRVRVFESNRHPALRHLSRLKPRLSIEPVQTQLGSHLDPCDAAFDPVLTHDCPNFVSICVIVAQALGRGFRDTLFSHTHTGEQLALTYAIDAHYLPDSLAAFNLLLRDHYSGEVGSIDPQLFDLLHQLQLSLGEGGAFEVISGYRCPATNTTLRRDGLVTPPDAVKAMGAGGLSG